MPPLKKNRCKQRQLRVRKPHLHQPRRQVLRRQLKRHRERKSHPRLESKQELLHRVRRLRHRLPHQHRGLKQLLRRHLRWRPLLSALHAVECAEHLRPRKSVPEQPRLLRRRLLHVSAESGAIVALKNSQRSRHRLRPIKAAIFPPRHRLPLLMIEACEVGTMTQSTMM